MVDIRAKQLHVNEYSGKKRWREQEDMRAATGGCDM